MTAPMIEVRNDLLTTNAQVLKTANELAKMIEQALQACHNLPDKKFGKGPQT